MRDNGNEIKEVVCKKGHYYLVFASFQIEVSSTTLTDSFFYKGKELNALEIADLKEKEKLIPAENYLKSLITKRLYTEKQLKDKLQFKFQIEEDDLDTLLKPYEASALVNDENYAISYAESHVNKGFGKVKIERELLKRGVDERIIHSREVQEILQSSDVENAVKRELEKEKNAPEKEAKRKVKERLLRRGFTPFEIDDAISKVDLSLFADPEKLSSVFLKTAQKCYNHCLKKSANPFKRKSDFFKALLLKGYSRDEIAELISQEGYDFHD